MKLFNRFLAIWNDKWGRQFNDNESAVTKEWTEALINISDEQIKFALTEARNKFAWPPSIAEFIEICRLQAYQQNCCVYPGCKNEKVTSQYCYSAKGVCRDHFHYRDY
jgi:hypothetical protein